jgi:hypothetical protein
MEINDSISKTDNAMANRNRTTEQTIADKTLQRKLIFFAIEQCELTKNMRLKSGAPKR